MRSIRCLHLKPCATQAEASGLEAMHKEDTEEGEERLNNIRELVNLSVRYDESVPPEGIERLLEDAALESDQDELAEKRAAVSLMTVHASKGLEFDAVFVTGLEQGFSRRCAMTAATPKRSGGSFTLQ